MAAMQAAALTVACCWTTPQSILRVLQAFKGNPAASDELRSVSAFRKLPGVPEIVQRARAAIGQRPPGGAGAGAGGQGQGQGGSGSGGGSEGGGKPPCCHEAGLFPLPLESQTALNQQIGMELDAYMQYLAMV